MVELSLMASATFPPGVLSQEQGICRPPKEFQALLPGHGKRQPIQRSGSMQLSAPHLEDPWQCVSLFSEYNQPAPTIKESVLIDVQDARPDSVLFSFGIAEQCTRHEKILKFLADGKGLDVSLLSDLTGFHTVAIDKCPQQHAPAEDEFCLYDVGLDDRHQFVHPQRHLYAPKPLLDFVGNLPHTSTITVHRDGRVLLTGSGAEMKNLLSVVAEFNLPKKTTSGSKQAMVVPYFTRSGGGHVRHNTSGSSLKFETQTVAPLKSPESVKLKAQPKKKKNRKPGRERDLYSKNYFHAVESLLTVVIDKKGGRTALLSLQKSGPGVAQLLSHFSAGIAGTGLAVLFSVACKVASGRAMAFSAAKLFNTGIGFGLFWLSCAVNRLQDTIVHVSSKNTSRLKLEEEGVIMGKVESCVNEVLFRAATVMAVAVLRFV